MRKPKFEAQEYEFRMDATGLYVKTKTRFTRVGDYILPVRSVRSIQKDGGAIQYVSVEFITGSGTLKRCLVPVPRASQDGNVQFGATLSAKGYIFRRNARGSEALTLFIRHAFDSLVAARKAGRATSKGRSRSHKYIVVED